MCMAENNEIKYCSCGGEMKECFFSCDILPLKPQITIDNGFYNNTVCTANAYVCLQCGKIDFYADTECLKSV